MSWQIANLRVIKEIDLETFWRIMEILGVMAAGHVLFGLWEDWLKKKKLFGYRDK